MSILRPVSYCLGYYNFAVNLEIGNCVQFALLKNYFGYFGCFLDFHMNFKVILSIYASNVCFKPLSLGVVCYMVTHNYYTANPGVFRYNALYVLKVKHLVKQVNVDCEI